MKFKSLSNKKLLTGGEKTWWHCSKAVILGKYSKWYRGKTNCDSSWSK